MKIAALNKVVDTSLWSRENIAWLAGILEGEGCFVTPSSPGSKTGIALAMTDEDVVRRAAAVAGCGVVYGPYLKAGRKPIWKWIVRVAEHVYALCAALYLHMGIRRRARIEELVAIFRTLPSKQVRHGTRSAYEKGCRCDDCRASNTVASREYHRSLRAAA